MLKLFDIPQELVRYLNLRTWNDVHEMNAIVYGGPTSYIFELKTLTFDLDLFAGWSFQPL